MLVPQTASTSVINHHTSLELETERASTKKCVLAKKKKKSLKDLHIPINY